MRLGALRPVGELVHPDAPSARFHWPRQYQVAWVDSGTSALAVAIKAAIDRQSGARRRVIVPAYTCPDVLSAVHWAGAVPVIVDTEPRTPWLAATDVAQTLDSSVGAVVAPHFLGLRHPLSGLLEVCRSAGIPLIEDSAQLGPASPLFVPAAPCVVVSFGRGKPVPAGGGALLFDDSVAGAVQPILAGLPLDSRGRGSWRVRIALQNAAMSRVGFRLVHHLPGLRVGETRYEPLRAPRRMSEAWGRQVEAVLAKWQHASLCGYRDLERALAEADCEMISSPLGWDGRSPLLRLPVLARTRRQRDSMVERMVRRGLGASEFYGNVLPEIVGVQGLEKVGELVHASDFAARFFTLPCHSGVSRHDVDRMIRVAGEANAAL